jgi:hypothetical protein
MSKQLKNYRSWLYYSFMTVCLSATQNAIADSGPSEDWLQSLYTQRVKADNSALVQFYGKQGATQLHGLKKVSCMNVASKATTQSCVVMVDITSFGLGRHKLNDQVVVKQTGRGQWVLISDVFN